MISMLIILFKYEDYRFFLVNFVNDEWYIFINVYFLYYKIIKLLKY